MSFAVLGLLLLSSPPVAASPEDAPMASKKERLLAEKAARHTHRARPPMTGIQPIEPVALINQWTHEILPVDPKSPPGGPAVDAFLRCHHTNQATAMDPRLLGVVLKAAEKFKRKLVEVVSGFRSPKYNLILRKKGHEVARDSQHPRGNAIDFRLPGLETRELLRFVRRLHLGGVGYYPDSSFVHADVGRVRYWRGH